MRSESRPHPVYCIGVNDPLFTATPSTADVAGDSSSSTHETRDRQVGLRLAPDARVSGRGARADRIIASAARAVLTPITLVRAAVALAQEGRVYDAHRRLGCEFAPITIRSYAGKTRGRRLGYLGSVARGDLRFIGPRPLDPDDWEGRARRSPHVTPGLMSSGRLRARVGLDYDPEPENDDQRIYTRSGLSLVARYGIAEVLGRTHLDTPPSFTAFGLEVSNASMDEALDWITHHARQRPASLLAFVNAACFNEKIANPDYAAALHKADLVLADGVGVKIAAQMRGVSILANVNGTDLFPRLCELAATGRQSIFLLGARPGLAQHVADNMCAAHPGLVIAGVRHGFFTPEQEDELIEDINRSKADVLLVALGVPSQELWLARNLHRLDVGVAMGVGGLFDFYSGRIPRAPQWLREIGLEWAWRLAQEPGRMWRRYVIGNPAFLMRAWRDAHAHRDSPAARFKRRTQRALLDYRDKSTL